MPLRLTIRAISILAAASVAAGTSAQTASSAGTATSRPPNILLIIADDFGMDVTSDMYPGLIEGLVERYGPSGLDHPHFRDIRGRPASTPTLDRLARQGMRFTNAWAHPFCSPTRASIITGLFAAKTEVTSYADALAQNHTTFVQTLQDEAGYSTAIFGKWHLAGLPGDPVDYPGMKPKEAGFDLFRGNLHAAIDTYWDYDYQVQDSHTAADQWRTEPPPTRALPGIAPTTFAPVVKVADTIEWITARDSDDQGKPWFAWLAFNLSHATIQRQPSQMAVPDADTLDAKSYNEMRECGGLFGSADTGACSGEAQMRAMTNAMDTVIGKLLAVVDALGPDTYVIFVGDNGTPMYNRPNLDFIDNMYITKSGRGKGTPYESGARVPMVIRGPGIEADSQSGELVHTVDLYSTILDLAGLEPPQTVSNSEGTGSVPLDAVSLAPIVFGGGSAVRDPDYGYLLTETVNPMTGGTRQVGARNASYKVVCTDGTATGDCEFYDLIADPLEEFPLDYPGGCRDFAKGAWSPADPHWHYCRLTEVVEQYSFLRSDSPR